MFSSFIIPACIPIYFIKENQLDRLLASSQYSQTIFAIASGSCSIPSSLIDLIRLGYFLWDLIISIYHFSETGPAFVFHASSCLVVFVIGLVLIICAIIHHTNLIDAICARTRACLFAFRDFHYILEYSLVL